MTLEQLSYAAQIVGTVGVILSLIFVGFQIRQNTAALQRSEYNSTMAQWSVIRMAIAENREIGELMTSGLQGAGGLDAADQLRLEQLLAEYAWAAFRIWDRTRRGVFPPGTFELTGGALLCTVLNTPGGHSWWEDAKAVGFIPNMSPTWTRFWLEGSRDEHGADCLRLGAAAGRNGLRVPLRPAASTMGRKQSSGGADR